MALRKAAIDYATCGALHPINERDRVSIVSLNAAFFDNDSAIRVLEPIVMLRLAHWLQTSKVAGIHGVIRRKLEDDTFSLTDAAFYHGLVALVWETLRSEPLDRWLNFPGLRPSWTQHGAALILPRFRQRRQPFAAYNRNYRSGSLLGFANSSDDVFTWLNNASRPFLIPDEGFGAELLFMLDLQNGNQVLAIVHTHFSDWKRKRRDLRVVPVRPDELYKNSPENSQRLMGILSKLPPLPIGSRKRARASDTPKDRYARLPLLRLLWFAEPWRVREAYDPPVASVNFRHLLELPAPVEFRLGDLERTILESV
ncbi:hypothetical protein EXIGLDRAFT_731045 [Exidia glandulosa HHB12029]|uniref:Uncharacterized protein n=1 Tax=Exidia glandulosa HHB12029 TaxID=1314781 RepID=A0A165L4L1_EXIGL|nr:hypothetical protein EXIGLDRAFT_731045 [Exidia glandulosa HHB12029]